MQYHAILFDLDGVIIDTHAAVTDFWQAQSARHGVTLTGTDFERDIYGCLPRYTLDHLFPHLSAAERQAVLEELDAAEQVQAYSPIPGAVDLLQALHRHGIPSALVTSATQNKIQAVTAQLKLEGLFDVRVGAEEITRGKPAPDGYILAAEQLNFSPAECIVFEDAVSGVQAAVSAGARCIGVQSPDRAPALVAVGATDIISDFKSIRLVGDHRVNPNENYLLDLGTRAVELTVRQHLSS